jgi:hypothetical protein
MKGANMSTDGYRVLTVKSVRRFPPDINGFFWVSVRFVESVIQFDLNASLVAAAQLIKAGDKIEILGRNGNSDSDIWGIDTLLDWRRVETTEANHD